MSGKHYKKRKLSEKIAITIVILAVLVATTALTYAYVIKDNMANGPGKSNVKQTGWAPENSGTNNGKAGGSINNEQGKNTSDGGSGKEKQKTRQDIAEKKLQKLISNMSLKEKVGQMIIVGFEGYDANPKVSSMIKDNHVGGIILYNRNIKDDKQLVTLNNKLKTLNKDNKLPVFISADHEGGRITRLPSKATVFPSNLTIGKKDSPKMSREIGSVLGSEMKAYGFNLDFAPVADIYSNPKNTVIGDRSFGTDYQTVSRLSAATMKGIKSSGVEPVVKHFPGHGDTDVDSHEDMPVLYKSINELKSFELKPFENAVNQGADMMMVSHIKLPKIDKTGRPASLSHEVTTDILRNDMGFNGVIITDDLEMGAISKYYGTGDAAVKAIRAGSDMVLVCHTYESQSKTIDAITEAVKNGQISEKRIDESVKRIAMLKQKYNLSDEPTSMKNVDKYVGNAEHKSIAARAAVR